LNEILTLGSIARERGCESAQSRQEFDHPNGDVIGAFITALAAPPIIGKPREARVIQRLSLQIERINCS
jgi:hypothetical protein